MIVIVAGVAGSGKTTVGRFLAERLHWAFADGDDFHSPASLAKMRAGIPLADADRWPWLRSVVAWMDEHAAAGESAVVACSVLRRAYRQVLLSADARPRMVFLEIAQDDCAARLSARHGHFFGRDMLDSQYAALEVPRPPEQVDLIPATGTPGQITDQIMTVLSLRP